MPSSTSLYAAWSVRDRVTEDKLIRAVTMTTVLSLVFPCRRVYVNISKRKRVGSTT